MVSGLKYSGSRCAVWGWRRLFTKIQKRGSIAVIFLLSITVLALFNFWGNFHRTVDIASHHSRELDTVSYQHQDNLVSQDTARSLQDATSHHQDLAFQVTPPTPTQNKDTTCPSSQQPTVSNMTILQDLLRCSRALGVSERSLLESKAAVEEVSRRVALFLKTLQPLLPSTFSPEYRNPCWRAVRPKRAYTGWKEMLMNRFHPETGRRQKKGMAWRYNDFLSKPVNNISAMTGTEEDWMFLCLPYFFLAGFPKSATTTIHKALASHHQVIQPVEKEPHWWTRALTLAKSHDFNLEYFPIAFTSYTFFFTPISETSSSSFLTYDGSQSTLWDSNFYYNGQEYCAMPAVLKHILPNAKFIVVMRNPVSRAYSHFLYGCTFHYGDIEHWPPEVRDSEAQLFDNQVTKGVRDFNECLKTMSTYECTSIRIFNASKRTNTMSRKNKRFLCGQLGYKLDIGLYVLHLRKWLQFYPIENFLFLRTEDIPSDPVGTMSKITNFLEIAPVPSRMARDVLGRMSNVLPLFQPMHNSTRALLVDFYRPYNQQLAELIGDNRFLWEE